MHKRKRDWSIKVYKYGIMTNQGLPDSWFMEHVNWVKTWNALIDKFKILGEDYQSIFNVDIHIKTLREEIKALTEKKQKLFEAIKKERIKLKSMKKDSSAFRQEIKEISSLLFIKRGDLKNLKDSFGEANKEKIKEHKNKTLSLVSKLIEDSGMYWTHKDYFKECWWEAIKKSHKGIPLYKNILKKDICLVHRYTGGGASLSTIFKPNKRFWIEPVEWDKVDTNIPQRQWKKLVRTKAHICFCGEEKIFSCVLHRQIPENSIVKQVRVLMRRFGQNMRTPIKRTSKTTKWEMNIFVEIPPEAEERRTGIAEKGKMVLELGWRKLGDLLRIGVYKDESGKYRQIIFPEKIASSIQKSQELQQKKDEELNKLRKLMKGKINIQSGISKYFEAAEIIEDNKLKGKIKIGLDRWKWYSYLINNAHHKASGYRKIWYYELAHEFFRNNNTVIIKEMDLKKLSQPKKDGEQGKIITDAQRLAQKYRALAAIGEFKGIIKAVACKYNAEVIEVPGENTTLQHFECGHIQVNLKPEERQQLYIKCQKCGERYDQDENSIENMDMIYLQNMENLKGFSTENRLSENMSNDSLEMA